MQYFEGLDSIGPKPVQERNAAIYGNHDEGQNIINFVSGMTLSQTQRPAASDEFDNGHRQIMLDTGLDVSYPYGPLLSELEQAAQARLSGWSDSTTSLGIPAQQAIASYRAELASPRYLLMYRYSQDPSTNAKRRPKPERRF